MMPLDAIGKMIGKVVTVTLKSRREFTGKLVSFDLNSNTVIEGKDGTEFIQGHHVCTVSCTDESAK